MKHFLSLIMLLWASLASGQAPNIGLIYESDSVVEGYTLFSADDDIGEVYFIDNCGRIINHWSFNEPPGLTSYLLDNGNLLFAGKDSLYIRDWNDNPVWTYAADANGIKQHHDIEPLPNGNVLCIVTDPKTPAQQINAGKDPSIMVPNFKLDKIVELQPTGTNGANIVWEWHFWDHLIQEYDSTKLNYGPVVDHPELIDFNFDQGYPADWTHLNSINYNSALDQIIISSRNMSEMYIIDHSTSTLEASGHTGGNSGKGGDFLWRWGNPQVYQHGTPADRKLFNQHDVSWVEENFLHEGKITVFNNGGDGSFTFSSIHLIEPEMSGGAYVLTNNTFGPMNFYYTWNGSELIDTLFSAIKAGVRSLPNGNFLICETRLGRFIEIDSIGEVVWQYNNPLGGGSIFNQFDLSANGNNPAYRAVKYLPSHTGLLLQSLSAGTIIEDQNSVSDNCVSSVDLSETIFVEIIVINPVLNNLIQLINAPTYGIMKLIDLKGSIIQVWEINDNPNYKLNNPQTGIYLIEIEVEGLVKRKRVQIISN